jgi:sporulation protein YlmC with PRC-barrel domain
MKLRHALPAIATALLLFGVPGLLLAQQSAGDLREIDDDDRIVELFNLSADRIDDMEVMTADGEEIGEIEDVLMDASARPVAVAVEVDDLLDVDDEERIIQLDKLKLEDDRFVTDLSKSEIESLPIWH